MKVFFIGASYESCHYVRCLVPMLANLWDGDKTSKKRGRRSEAQIAQGIAEADVIVFHRPIDRNFLESAKTLKSFGKKIVLDNDDTYIKDSGVPLQMISHLKEEVEKRVQQIDDILKEFASISDMVTVSTEFLAEEYRKIHNNVVVLPNCVDKRDWFIPKKNTSDKVRIGIVGSVASNQDYKQIIPLLDELKKMDNVKLVLFSLPMVSSSTKLVAEMYKPEYKFWEQYNPEWHPFCPMEEYMFRLNNLQLDIMLIPRFDSYFNRAKSNVKFLEASMCKVPVIAQGFPDRKSPYEVNPDDAKHMIICGTENEWIYYTKKLIDDKELRDKMANEAYNYVVQNYEITNKKHLWSDAYKKLF